MTTTYELYTNENGTPKAVEGKAPAIIERVETLETNVKTLDGDIKTLDEDVGNIQTAIEVLEGGVVKTINGVTPDQAGNIDIPVGHNVGEEWVSYTGKIPNGGVPYCGQTVTRATYADLWAYAQAQGLVKTESEWQSWASSHGGNVPYYSSGNGSSTFRMPSIKGYVKGASSQSEAGAYVAEGLPNITGSITTVDTFRLTVAGAATSQGALSTTSVSGNYFVGGMGSAQGVNSFILDASGSNPIYGNSDHVTPETSVVMFGVYAFGEITNQGALDATTLATGLAKVEANVGGLETNKLDKSTAHIVETWKSGANWYRKWSDGFIEQGGYYVPSTTVTEFNLTFNTPFSNTNYTLTFAKSTGNYANYYDVVFKSRSASYAVISFNNDRINYYGFCWYACGY